MKSSACKQDQDKQEVNLMANLLERRFRFSRRFMRINDFLHGIQKEIILF